MDIVLPLLSVAGGIAALAVSGDVLVRHSSAVAVRHHVPKTIVGAVILGFGTSLPELFVSLLAAMEGSPDIAIANVVGSNIANIGLILGTGALLVALPVQRRVTRVDLPVGLLTALFLLLWVQDGRPIGRAVGAAFLAGFAGYLWLSMRHTRAYRLAVPREEVAGGDARSLLWIAACLGGLALGARFLVWGGIEIAGLLQIEERVIGLGVVAVGTSLPELAAMVAAARKREVDLAVGNVVGSNIFNLLLVLGTTAAVHPIPVHAVTAARDLPIMAIMSVLAFPFLARERRLTKRQGAVLLVAFAVYFVWLWKG